VGKSGMNTSGSEAVVRMRGLPFGCSKEEIMQFFQGESVFSGRAKLKCCYRWATSPTR